MALTRVSAPLSDQQAAQVRDLAAAAAADDSVQPISEQPLLWLQDPEAQVVHLLAYGNPDHAGTDPHRLVGYAQVDLRAPERASAELVVHPDFRRGGHGGHLLDGISEIAARASRKLSVWAHGNLPAAQALAKARGLVVVRELLTMSLDLNAAPVPAAELPQDVTVREFVVGQDEQAWLKQNARAFADHPEQGRLTLKDLQARENEDWFDPAGFLLAERRGKLLGSAWTKVSDGVGEIYAVGVVPSAQGLGLGHALTRLALTHLTARGLPTAILYVDGDNTSAIRTYEAAGFSRAAVSVQYGDSEI